MEVKETKTFTKVAKQWLHRIFIDGLSGMALGLFATLIVGTILGQIATFDFVAGTFVGNLLTFVANLTKTLMGVGIGVGIAYKFKESPLVTVSAGVCGFVGAYAASLVDMANGTLEALAPISKGTPGDPLCAFVAAMVGIEIGRLVAGKTRVDILVTPIVTVVSGAAAALLCGKGIAYVTTAIGNFVGWSTEQQPFLMGIVVAVVMGLALTLPISSAAIGVVVFAGADASYGLALAAGAAAAGCSAQMVGFAVASFRENRFGGLISQGIGTSMLQMPNIVKNPRIWIPATVASAVVGPVSSVVFKMTNNAVGSGMGTSGLVGQINAYAVMDGAWYVVLGEILLVHVVLPAVIALGVSELLRKAGWIKENDMKLDM
ncbi:MAG: PTS sugar transporter subunit IIC [Clostridia bacterium]|nr:PTS sugar transporter subunit IIC [Clostridia bacterium]